MPKVVTSKVPAFKGSVVLTDPLTMPLVKAIEEAIEKTDVEEIKKLANGKETIKLWVVDERMLPAICLCVQEWSIEGITTPVTPETFPMSPIADSHNLIKFLFNEIRKIYIGEKEIPNE